MSHLHIPDGLLPVWLWAGGLILMALIVGTALVMVRSLDLKRKVPLLGLMSAMMLVGMNIEIPPYHMNLSVLTGIILGPWLGIIAALIVHVILAVIGHGGVTVVGLNTVVLSTEAVMGFILFRAFSTWLRPALSAGLATLLSLMVSTALMLSIVYLANVDFSSGGAHGIREIMESGIFEAVRSELGIGNGFNFRLFAVAAVAVGLFGWTIESLVSSAVVRFIAKVKPDLISGGKA